ncbi:hypothetical protein [Catellatospora sp. NPDC049609]|uniref:hypothetical protein n=1 Tax=Catellatospora sp. NPDC049609 TaxID=3155505 RepID=UPI00341D22E2
METAVLHQPRVAWDTATVLVTAAGADHDSYAWFAAELAAAVGPSCLDDLLATREHLLRSERADARSIEAGKWRVRLEDMLRARPDLSASLHQLSLSARVRLAHTI